MSKAVKGSASIKKRDSKLRFNTNGSSLLATMLAVASAVVMVAIVTFLFQISNRVNDINTGKVADGRLSDNVVHYNDPAPTFKHYVKAPGFVGNLVGNADSATALTADPMDCGANTFATAIDQFGNLSCESDGAAITNVDAVTLNGHSSAFFQDASNLTTGTVDNARLSSAVTLQGNNFNSANQLVMLNADGSLPALNAMNLFNINASALAFGTVSDARLSTNVAKYNDATPTFTSPVTAPAFNGALNGNATTATALAADPADCAIGAFANAINSTGDLTCSTDGAALTNLDATNITTGTLDDARLSANVTVQGNTFNGANQLVQLDGTGALPALDAAALLNITGANVTGTVANAQDSVNFTGVLAGDVTGTQGATVVSNVSDAALSSNVVFLDGSNGLDFTGAGNIAADGFVGDGFQLTNLNGAEVNGPVANATDAVNFTGPLVGDVTGTQGATVVSNVQDSALSANVTLQGNAFNGANQLVQLDATGALPTLDGAALTNLTGANVTGVVANATDAVNFTGALSGDVTGTQGATIVSNVEDAALSANVALLDGGNGLDFTGAGTLTADAFVGDGSGLTNITATTIQADQLTNDPTDCAVGAFANAIDNQANLSCSNDGSALINLDASNVATGTLSDAVLSANVTLQGNTFNGANQLVQLDATGALPTLDGAALTNLTGANVTGTVANATDAVNFTGALLGDVTGTQGATVVSNVSDAALSANVTLQGNTFNNANELVQLDAAGALPVLDGAALTNLTGANVTGTVANATDAVNFTGVLAGDVTGTQGATVVSSVSDTALSANVALLDGSNGLTFTGALSATSVSGDGSGLTNLTGANVVGPVATADALTLDPADCAAGAFANAINATGDLTCSTDGSALTSLNGAEVTGTVANATDAVNFTGALAGDVTGAQGATVVSNVDDAALSLNVALLDGTNGLAFTGNLSATTLSGDGAGLTNLTGAEVTGSVALADALTVDPADCAANTYANAIDAQGNLSCAGITDGALSANVTVAGNTFNGAGQLVQLDGTGAFTALDAGNLTNLTGANVQGDITGNASNITGTVADANVADNLTINGGTINNTVIGGTTAAAGTFTTLNTTGLATLNSLAVTNNATVGGTLTVTGITTLNNATTVNSTLTVTGATSLGSVTISGTSTHTGAATFNGTASFTNTLTATAGVNFSGASSMRAPVTAVNITDGVTSCVGSGSGALTLSTNGNFFGCDGATWRRLNN